MTDDIENLLAELKAAAASPDGLTLRNVDLVTAGQPDLRRALECAAVPHWWDEAILAQLLPEGLAKDAGAWAEKLRALDEVEPFLAQPGAYNVHEVTRQALRAQLHREGRLVDISRRALKAFPFTQPSDPGHLVVEHLFHLLVAEPEEGSEVFNEVWYEWWDSGQLGSELNLAAMLDEVIPYLIGPARARALLRRAATRKYHRPSSSLVDDANEALRFYQAAGADEWTSIAHDLCGDLLTWQQRPGDLDKALEHRDLSLEITEKILEDAPESTQAQRNVSVSLNLVADLLKQRNKHGDCDRALEHYERSLEIWEKLLKVAPESAQAQRDVTLSLERVADLLKGRNQDRDPNLALGLYERSLEIREKLLKAAPESAQAQRDLSFSLGRVADLLKERNQDCDRHQALSLYERSLELSRKLLKAAPESALAQRDVWRTCWKLASLAEKMGNGDAEGWWRRALEGLQGMKDRGFVLSAADDKDLELLKEKLG